MIEPIYLTIIGIVVMLTLTFGFVLFVVMYKRRVIGHQTEIKEIQDRQQMELSQAAIRAEEGERMRIASELHDDVGATLASVRLFLSASIEQNGDKSIILESKELLDESIGKIRNISHKLQPALLTQLGLAAALQSFATMISKPGNIAMHYRGNSIPRLQEDVELSIYRVVQELTNNIIRHAAATFIELSTEMQSMHLYTTIVHDGIGLTEAGYQEYIYKKGSIGLKNIVTRLASINASISFKLLEDGRYAATITKYISPDMNPAV